ASFAPAARVDLRLDDDDGVVRRRLQALGDRRDLFELERWLALRDGDPVAGEELLGLILGGFHDKGRQITPSAPPNKAHDSPLRALPRLARPARGFLRRRRPAPGRASSTLAGTVVAAERARCRRPVAIAGRAHRHVILAGRRR